MKIAISIPVHENSEVVINQIENFKKYIPNVLIVLHFSKEFDEDYALREGIIQEYPFVYVNPVSVDCSWDNIIWSHISNFKYISTVAEFDYFMMHASNDMYILPGIEKYVAKYTAGFHIHHVFKTSRWWPGNQALLDRDLEGIMNMIHAKEIIATQVESSFYKRDLFERIVMTIESFPAIRRHAEVLKYTREEVYFSTIAYALIDHDSIGYPTTFSEVHRFDRIIWSLQFLIWGTYNRSGLCRVIPREKYDEFEKKVVNRITKLNPGRLRIKDVKKILYHDKLFIWRNLYLFDCVSRYRLYGKAFFSVKRVNRDITNPLRQYINTL